MRINWRRSPFRTTWRIYLPEFGISDPGTIKPKVDPWHILHSRPPIPSEPPQEINYIDRLAEAEFAYQNWQLQEGREVFGRGFGPQDASELRNLMAYQEDQGIQGIIDASDDYPPGPFGTQHEFHPYGNPVETSHYVQPPEPQPDELELMDRTEPVEDMEPMPQQQSEEPMPDPMEGYMEDPYDPMNPMGMGPFDPMDPMGMGGLF